MIFHHSGYSFEPVNNYSDNTQNILGWSKYECLKKLIYLSIPVAWYFLDLVITWELYWLSHKMTPSCGTQMLVKRLVIKWQGVEPWVMRVLNERSLALCHLQADNYLGILKRRQNQRYLCKNCFFSVIL